MHFFLLQQIFTSKSMYFINKTLYIKNIGFQHTSNSFDDKKTFKSTYFIGNKNISNRKKSYIQKK